MQDGGVDCGSITMKKCMWCELLSNSKSTESHEWALAGTCHIEAVASSTTQERSYKATQTRLLVSRWKQNQAGELFACSYPNCRQLFNRLERIAHTCRTELFYFHRSVAFQAV